MADTTPESVKTKATEHSTVLTKFVKEHPSLVKFERKEDGTTKIRVEFGSSRETEIKEVSKFVTDTIYGDLIKLGSLDTKVVMATESTIVLSAKTADFTTYFTGNKAKDEVGDSIIDLSGVTPTSIITEMKTKVSTGIKTVLETIVNKKYSILQETIIVGGIEYVNFGRKARIIINLKKLFNYYDKVKTFSTPSAETIKAVRNAIDPIIYYLGNYTKDLVDYVQSEAFATVTKADIERLSDSVLDISYDTEVYVPKETEENKGEDEEPSGEGD